MNPLPSHPSGGNFMDRNTLVALVLVTIMFVAWQNYTTRGVVSQPAPVEKQVETPAIQGEAATLTAPNVAETQVASENLFEEQTYEIKGQGFTVALTNKGMGFKKIRLDSYTDREGELIELGLPEQSVSNFGLKWDDNGQDVLFNVEKIGEYEYIGTSLGREWKITRKISLQPETYSAVIETTVDGPLKTFPGIRTVFVDELQEREKAFLFPSFEHQDIFVVTSGKEEREILDPEKIKKEGSSIKSFGPYEATTLASVSRQYFSLALIDQSEVLPTLKFFVDAEKESAAAEVLSKPLNVQGPMTLKQTAYFGAKSLPMLNTVNENLSQIMELGFFAGFAKPLLRLLSFFQGFLGNWGLAIIALTLIVRGLLLPLNISSFRSMKKMQNLQGPMKALKEKYKDDRQKMNEEMAALFRREKVNPLGGCLPMLIQLPIFFSLYQVFSKSIELYQAPFVLWIQDLSAKDPYYVLPVLMGVTMFLQQLLTPSTMDPAQKKIMMVIPIVFSFMMLTLPSGLTLYIFVSTLFGVIQQFIMMKDNAPAVAATAKA